MRNASIDEDDFGDYLLNALLEHQKPNGEFGKTRVKQVVETVRSFHSEENLVDKPQSFTTMMAIEQLYRWDENKFHKEIDAALAWMHRQTESGFFVSRAVVFEPTDTFTSEQELLTQKIKPVKVYRHTAEACYSFVQFESITYRTINIINNILSVQNEDGGWSNTELVSESKLLSTTFCIQALCSVPIDKLNSYYPPDEQEGQLLRIRQSVNSAVNWLISKNKEGEGFWYLPDVSAENKYFYTGIVLSRIPQILIKNCPYLVQTTVDRLLKNRKSGIWYKNETPDYDGTARVAAALVRLREGGIHIDEEIIRQTQQQLLDSYMQANRQIDPATIGYLLESFHHASNISKEIASPYEYQVALSFAGEDRKYADALARLLKDKGISVFYDSYEQATLWGKDLFQHLQMVYRDKSKFCVIFLSESYAKKLWTKHELKQAQARAFTESREYILPIRIDDTEIPGVNDTVSYIDLSHTSIEEITELIAKKLS